MAEFNSSTRTNYFRVKNAEAFTSFIALFDGLDTRERDGKFVIYGECDWPTHLPAEDDEDPQEIDFSGEVASHLVAGEIAVFMEVGSEKLSFLGGWAEAVRSDGEAVSISLDEIYARAAEAFSVPAGSISRAEL
jgi:hypothetical protein